MCMLHFQHFSVVSSCISSAQQSHVAQHGSKREKNLDTPMFSAVLLAMVKTWKQLKCPLQDEWIRRWNITRPQHERNNAVCSNAGGPRDHPTKWREPGRERQTSQDATHRQNLFAFSYCSRKGEKLGTEYVKAVYCHRANLTYMRGTSCGMLGWKKHRLESEGQE